ncbi:MAG: prepilin peptidase [Planctomycetota bacterium]
MNLLRKKLPLIATLVALLLALATYVIGMAHFQAQESEFYTFEQLIKPRIVDVVIATWLFYVGCSIGSFLNVVAWRMPRGQEISGSSHCPRCAKKLIWRDNFPVFGWISRLGRCRYCGSPISRRYPIVEAMVGISIVFVAIPQIYAASLPLPEQVLEALRSRGGPVWSPRASPTVLFIVTYHVLALATLWALALIRVDGVKLPSSIQVFAGITVLAPMFVNPSSMVVSWQSARGEDWSPHGMFIEVPVRIATSLVAAAFLGRVLARRLCPQADLKLDPLGKDSSRLIDLILMLSIPAVLIGWHSMPAIVVVSAVVSVLIRPLVNWIPINDSPKRQLESRSALEYFSISLPLVLAFQLAFWRPLWQSGFWPSDVSPRNVILLWAVAALIVPSLIPSESLIPSDERPVQSPNVVQEDDDDDADQDDEEVESDREIVEQQTENDDADSADELPDQKRDAETDDGYQR